MDSSVIARSRFLSPVIARSVNDEAKCPKGAISNHNNKPSYLAKRSLYNSLKFALEGFKFAFKTQANLRIHILIGALVVILGLFLGVSNFEMIILSLVIVSVIICELINTAVEVSLDLVNGNKFNPLVKIVKDVVAAAVLLASINALVVGAIIFLKYLNFRLL